MHFFEILVLVFACVVAIAWSLRIRDRFRRGFGASRQMVNITMLFVVSIAVVLSTHISPFHLAWMFPTAFVLGLLSIISPFSLLSIFGGIFSIVWMLGLDRREVEANEARVARFKDLVRSGVDREEAAERAETEHSYRDGING